jgi:hypothetical protein
MIVSKVNKLRPGHSALTTEKWVEQIYKKYDTSVVNVGSEGVYFYMLADVLNELKIGTWNHEKPAADKMPELIVDKLKPDTLGLGPINSLLRGFPMLLDVDWGGFGRHVVVLDTVTKVPGQDAWWLAICDPLDGDVHITKCKKGEPIQYEGRRVTWSINFWGSPEQNYTKGKTSQGTITNAVYCVTPP